MKTSSPSANSIRHLVMAITTTPSASTPAPAAPITPAVTTSTAPSLSLYAGVLGFGGGAADGTGAVASFSSPYGVPVDSAGNLYVADTGNHAIRKMTPAGVVTTLVGTAGVRGSVDGVGAAAQFNVPQGIVIDNAGNLYVADTGNNSIRKITPAGVVTTVVGAATISAFVPGTFPGGLVAPTRLTIRGTSLYITSQAGVAVVNNFF